VWQNTVRKKGGYMDKKKTVQVLEKDGELLVVDELKNTTLSYRRTSRRLYVAVNDLAAFEYLDDDKNNKTETLSRRIRGRATLEDRAVSVIGDKENSSRELALTFRVLTDEQREYSTNTLREVRASVSSNETTKNTLSSLISNEPEYLDSMLCFTKSDWEIGNPDEWWLEVYLSQEVFDRFYDRLIASQVRRLSLGFKFVDIYSDSLFDPPSYKGVTWLLRPSLSDGNPYNPEPATGKLDSFSLELVSSKLEPADNDVSTNAVGDASDLSDYAERPSPNEPKDQLAMMLKSVVIRIGRSGIVVATAVIFASIIVFFGLLISGR
jgi:hypothetical protein